MNPKIAKYLDQGEGLRLDYKQALTSASKIAKTLAGFANTSGGTLLIGVRDNRTICGINAEEEAHMLELAGTFYSKPQITVRVMEHKIDGKSILEAWIAEGEEKPYSAKDETGKWWVYVRAADKTLLASKTTVDFLKRKYSEEETRIAMGKLEKDILEFIGSGEKTTLYNICKRFNLGRRRVSRILVDLMAIGVVRSHTIEKMEFYTSK